MRATLATTLLVVVLLAAGCGGSNNSTPGTTVDSVTSGGPLKPAPNGEASKPAATVLADAVKAANAASSVHIAGTVNASGKKIGLDLSIAKAKGATGSMTLKGAKVDLVLIGKDGYMRGSSAFWKEFAGQSGAAIAQLLSGKWLKFPTSNSQFGPITGLANTKRIFGQLNSHTGTLANRGATTYEGQSVVAIYAGSKNGTLYVAATGTPYPVALVKATGASSGAISFDRWNQSVALTAPKGAIDFSNLGGGA